MRPTPKILALSLLCSCILLPPRAEQAPTKAAPARRALLVGIDKYTCPEPSQGGSGRRRVVVQSHPAASSAPPEKGRGTWIDLDGAVNDVLCLRDLLVARFGFRTEEIHVLRDQEATRERILGEIQGWLVQPSGRGDLCLFFYAGHGSQVLNSKSREMDRRDETLVPADSCTGAPDIRDKELARLFNAVLDRGASLSVVLDSCHSGSIARGLSEPLKVRSLPPDLRDIAQEDPDFPDPESRGALIFSSAQDFQSAGEKSDPEGVPHGLFSMALASTLRSAPPDEPVARTFLRVKARMQAEGRTQEPVLACPPARLQEPLFGGPAGRDSGRTAAAVLSVSPSGTVELQGGAAAGFREGCELVEADAPPGGPAIRLRITAVDGLSRSRAEALQGTTASLQAGELFHMDGWSAGPGPRLKVWVPPAFEGEKPLAGLAAALREKAGTGTYTWVEDPTLTTPSHVLRWRAGRWVLCGPGGDTEVPGKTVAPSEVLSKMKASRSSHQSLYVELPPTSGLASALLRGCDSCAGVIGRAETPGNADYLLAGRLGPGGVEYAWVLPDSTAQEVGSASAMPARTDWVRLQNADREVAAAPIRLDQYALRLARLKAWLTLEGPPEREPFPYRLALREEGTGRIAEQGSLRGGEKYDLVLKADPGELDSHPGSRWVYVFTLDSGGNGQLLYPSPSSGNVENYLPGEHLHEGEKAPPEIPLAAGIRVSEPYGLDTYILLTSVEALPNPDVLTFDGVRTFDAANLTSRGASNPLEWLVQNTGVRARGTAPLMTLDWSIQRLCFLSRPPVGAEGPR